MALSKQLRFEILVRDNCTCQYCGRRAPDVVLQVDHIIPRSKGGSNEKYNLAASCDDCNLGKRAMLWDQMVRRDEFIVMAGIVRQVVRDFGAIEIEHFLTAAFRELSPVRVWIDSELSAFRTVTDRIGLSDESDLRSQVDEMLSASLRESDKYATERVN